MAKHLTRYITFLFFLLIGAIIFFLWHAGFLTPIRLSQVQTGPYYLVYQSYQGDYAQGVQVMNNVYTWLKDNQIKSTQGFGLYFDDPRKVEPSRLRALIGNIISNPDEDTLAAIRQHFQAATFAPQPCLQSSFPFRSRLSIIIGITKVYPQAEEWLKQHQQTKRSVMEIYDSANNKIIYLFPFDTNNELINLYNPKALVKPEPLEQP